MKKVVIFARVSSTNGTQDYERQINDLQTLASANNWTVEAVLRRKYLEQKRTQNAQS
jgi:predicted site-specific integrase-resolvase